MVGIGTSAGGLAALKKLLSEVPAESGVAWVVVVHLSPEHESYLAEILQPHVRVPVQQVTETLAVEADHVYVIPPGRNLEAIDTHLRLAPLEEDRRQRMPIDHFFRTLAAMHDGQAVGVILTGTGADGTLGLRAIKENTGVAVAQDPTEAEYDAMPQSAIASGMVDLVLPLERIPAAILRLAHTRPKVPSAPSEEEIESDEQRLLAKILDRIRSQTGRDFSRYKKSTVLRRISRRMQLRHIEELPAYLDDLQKDSDEVRRLSDELLITVTDFFRDEEIFHALEKDVIPDLFRGKESDESIRVWSAGCSTGEEAYSLAILLLEEATRRDEPSPRLQVFATDLHEPSLERARNGFYPGDVEADVAPERLQRFFEEEDGGYRVRKELRDLVVFAPHDLLSDPPFSRLDLVTCRNLLIYLQSDVQRDVIDLFHYALEPGGYLVLGTSETVDSTSHFTPSDRDRGIYRRREATPAEPRLPVFPLTRLHPAVRTPAQAKNGEASAYGGLHVRMLERFAPPSLLLGPDDEVVHLSEHAGRYMVHPGGEPTSSIHQLLRQELRLELRTALHATRREGEPVRTGPVTLSLDGGPRRVILDLRAAPGDEAEGFVLLIFDERPLPDEEATEEAEAEEGAPKKTSKRVEELETELYVSRDRVKRVIDEYETSQEELRASNEELQSANEELRSTLEELETSKEELQSINEELQTVNQENRHKVEELAQMASDLQNLLSATEIATLFLDRELRILRFTPKVAELFNVRPADRGRPLSDLTKRIGYDDLEGDALRVLERLARVEREVQDESGNWYLTRVLPYRSADDRIEGVVLTFVDITGRKETEEALRQSEEKLEERVERRTRQVRTLASRLTRAEQEERRRLARILHDDLQQELYGVHMKLEMASRALETGDVERAKERITQADELTTGGVETARRLSADLSPPILDSGSPREILDWLAKRLEQMHGLRVELVTKESLSPIPEDLRVILFHVVRELLFNVVKHAETDRARVEARKENGELLVQVSDEGRGLELAQREESLESGLGVAKMRERVRHVGGRLDFASSPGKGTRVTMRLPAADSLDGSAPGSVTGSVTDSIPDSVLDPAPNPVPDTPEGAEAEEE